MTTSKSAKSPLVEVHKDQSHDDAIFTIGHGTRTIDDFINLLTEYKIAILVDVRSFPNSRTNPQFNRNDSILPSILNKHNIRYEWMGPSLGGRRNAQPTSTQHSALRVASFRNYAAYMQSNEWKTGLEKLMQLYTEELAKDKAVVYMCSETLWWKCHRRMISDYFVSEGWTVKHIGIKAHATPEHVIWDLARRDRCGNLIYDLGGGKHGAEGDRPAKRKSGDVQEVERPITTYFEESKKPKLGKAAEDC